MSLNKGDSSSGTDSELNWVKTVLTNSDYFKKFKLDDAISIKQKDLSNTNSSNGSTLKKLAITCSNAKGENTTRHVILKSKRLETGPTDVTELLGSFPIEIKLYSEVLPQINELLDIKKLSKPWPDYYGFKGTNILLEDLEESGFKMKPNRKMDYDHAKISIKELGKYHAMTIIIVEKGLTDPAWFKPYIYARHLEFMINLNTSAFNGLVNSMRHHWGQEWAETANKIVKLTENIGDTLESLVHSTKGKCNVINHGEYWLNNLVFKYNSNDEVTAMKILDFQVSHYNSPSWDLAIFLYGSLMPDLRNQYKEALLETYYDEFVSILKIFEFGGYIPSLSYFEKELDDIWFFCFLASISAPPWMLSMAKEGTHHEDDIAGKTLLPSFHTPCYQWQVVRDTMKKEVQYWKEKGKL